MNKKKITKVALATTLAASAFVAANPAQADASADAAALVRDAQVKANALRPFYNLTSAGDIYAPGLNAAVAEARTAIQRAKRANLTPELQAGLANAEEHWVRAARIVDAQNIDADLKAARNALAALVSAGVMNDALETAYDFHSAEILRAERAFARIFGADNRKIVLDAVVLPSKIAREGVMFEVSRYKLVKQVDALIAAGAELAKLGRLQARAIEIKAAGNQLHPGKYPALPAIEASLSAKEAATQANFDANNVLKVVNVKAVNATTVQVTFNDGKVETFTVDALEAGKATAVEVEYKGEKFTVNVTWAGTETPVGEATVKVTGMQGSAVAQNQALVKVAEIEITGGKGGASINGLTLQRSGLSADTDIRNIVVYDGTERLNVPAIIAQGKSDFEFMTPLQVAEGTTKKLDVYANVAAGAVQGNQFSLAVTALKTSANVSGTLPVQSGIYTITQVTLGSLTVSSAGDAPSTGINPGDKNVVLGKYQFTAANEDIKLDTIRLTQRGTAGSTDIQNLALFVNGQKVSDTKGLSIGNTVTFSLNNVTAKNGENLFVELRGDVIGGANRTTQFNIDRDVDVIGIGQTYGTNIVSGAAVTNSATRTIGAGRWLVSLASTSPVAGTVSANAERHNFAQIRLEAVGERVQVTEIQLSASNLTEAARTSNLRNARLLVGDRVVGTLPQNTAFAGTAPALLTIPLSNPIIVEPGKPVVLTVQADTNNATADDRFRVGLAPNGITGTGLSTGNPVNSTNASAVLGSQMTVGAQSVSFSRTSRGAQTVFQGQTNVQLIEYNLTHNLSEKVTLSQLEVDLSANGGTIDGNFTNMKLVDTEGNILTNVRNSDLPNTQSGQVVLTFNQPLTIDPNQTKKVRLVADVTSDAGAHTYQYGIRNTNTVARLSNGSTVTVSPLAAGAGPTSEISVGGSVITVARSVVDDVVNANVTRGETDVKVGAFSIQTGTEAARISEIRLGATVGNGLELHHFSNVRITDSQGNVLGSVATFTDANEVIRLDNPLVVNTDANNRVELKVLADVASNAPYTGTLTFAVGDGDGPGTSIDIRATSVHTGQAANITNLNVPLTAEFAVVPSKVRVAAETVTNPITSSGGTNPALVGNQVARFTFSNTGSQPVQLRNIQLNDTLHNEAFAGHTDASIQLFNASSGVAVSASTAFGATNELNVALNGDGITIDPGSSVTIAVRISNVGSIVAGDATALRVLKAGTNFNEVTSNTGAPFIIENNAASQVVTFVRP